MHIAWLGKKTPFCGNVTYSREITSALLDRGHQVSFLHFAPPTGLDDAGCSAASCHGPTNHSDRSWPSCPEIVIPCWYKSQIYTIPTLNAAKVLARSLRELQPDLVHASLTLSPLDFYLPELCANLGLPLVATFHPPFDRHLRNWQSSTQFLAYQFYAPFLARYDRTIVFSELQRDLLVRQGVPPERLAIIPNGVDEVQYSPATILKTHTQGILKDYFAAERLFVYQGRLSAEKNVAALLRAWQQAKMSDRCKLAIVGDGPLGSTLRGLYAEERNILWLGYVADARQRIDILRAADAFILPSLVEGLSLSLLEAMACGTACAATDAGADGEVLAGGAGIVLDTRRLVEQLCALLPQLRDRPDWTADLGQRARQRILDRYTLARNVTQLEALYAKLRQGRQLELSSSV